MKVILKISCLLITFVFQAYQAQAAVIRSEQISNQYTNKSGSQLAIQFLSETVATPGSSAVNTSASQIKLTLDLGMNCTPEIAEIKGNLSGVGIAGIKIIQVLPLRKMKACQFSGVAAYDLLIETTYAGQIRGYKQALELESGESFQFSLGQR